jgi:hypothetical protein
LSIFEEKDGKKKLPRSMYVKFLIFLGLIGLSAALMRPVQSALSRQVLEIRAGFIEKLEDFTGMEVRYSSLRPTFFGSFDIRNLRFQKGETPFLTVSRIRIYFSLSDLLLRKKSFIHNVQIDRPIFHIDVNKDKDTLEIFSSLLKNSEPVSRESFLQIADFLPQRADYRIQNCSLFITDGQMLYQMEGMNLFIRGNGGEITLDGNFGVECRYAGLFDKTIIVRTGVGFNGVCTNDLERGGAEIVFSDLTCFEQQNVTKRQASFFGPPSDSLGMLFSVSPIKAVFSYDEKELNLKQPDENSAVDYYFYCDMETGGISAGINFNDFFPGEKIVLSDSLKGARRLLQTRITGGSSFTCETSGAMDYKVNLSGGNTGSSLSDGFIINFYGNENNVVVNDFRLNSASASGGVFQGSLGFSGNTGFAPFRPVGTIFFDRFSLTGNGSVNAVFNVASRSREIQISSEQAGFSQAEFGDLNVFFYPSEKDVGISVSGLCGNGGEVYFDAILNRNPGRLESSLALVSVSLFEITEIFRPFTAFIDLPVGKRYLKKTLFDTEIFFSTDFNNIMYNAPNIYFSRDGARSGMLSLSGTDRQFTLNEGIFYVDENEFLLSANFNFSNPMELAFSVNAGYLDLSWQLEGQLLDRTTLIIHDPHGLNAYGSVSSSGAVSGYIEGKDFPILINAHPVYLNFYTAMRYNSIDFWNLDVNNFSARDLNSPNGINSLSFSGVADQDGATFRNLTYSDSVGMLTGSADFSWDVDFSYLEFLVNITDGHEDGEFYFLEGVLKNENINVRASVSQMHIDRFVDGPGTMLVSAEADASWNSIDSFNISMELTSLYTKIYGDEVHASVSMDISNDELNVRDLKLNYGRVNAFLPELQLSHSDGILWASADIKGYDREKRLEGKIDLNVSFAQTASWLEMARALDNFEGTLLFEDVQYGDLTQDRFFFEFSGNEGAISLSGGTRDMIRLEMDEDGNFFMGLSAPVPIRCSIAGTFRKGILDAHCKNFFIDMASLWALFGSGNDFNVSGGYITGTIDIRGPVWNPEFFGEGRGSSFRLQVPSFISEDIRPVPFEVLAEGYEMTFGPVVTMSGAGGGQATGWLRFENWAPVNVGLEISVPRESPIPYDFNITGFLASGNASGNLEIAIDTNMALVEVRGDLFSNDAEIGLNMGELMNNSDDNQNSDFLFHTFVEMKITSGSMVEFAWPNKDSPILRANPEMGTVFYVASDTQTAQFSLNGDIKIRSGELNYFDRSFYIRQGNIVFKENEMRFDPHLSVRAEMRDRSDTGPVTISMIIDNQPLFSFEPRFEASPGLTQLEIYSILGQNLNSIQGYENADMANRILLVSATDILTQVAANSNILSQFVFTRQFERQIRNFLGLDMFSVRTRFLQNVVVSSAMGLGRQAPVDSNNRVGNYFDNTTVFIGKYITQDMFIQGMLAMKYDENSALFGGIRFEPDIGIELQNPLFNIRWDFYPYRHPENWWANDNSITLSWSKSF